MNIKIYKKNESILTVQCNSTISKELYHFFSCMSSNYKFDPRYKSGIWDGKLHFFSIATNEISIGLYDKIFDFARKGSYTVETTFKNENVISREQFQKFINYLKITNANGEPMTPYPYQFEAAYEACCRKQINVHISTAGGKSLVIYIICRFLEMQKKRVLIVVPQTQLCSQLFSDFIEYSIESEYKTQDNMNILYSDSGKFDCEYKVTLEDGSIKIFNEYDIVQTKRGKIQIKNLKDTDELIL
jgi:hypothetical protein